MSTTHLFYVDPNAWTSVIKIFGRTEEMLEDDVRTIRDWLKTQTHFPEIMEDSKIKCFLILNQCSIEVTKQKIDFYYTVRSVVPELFTDCNPKLEKFQIFRNTTYFCLHPKMVEGKYRTWFLKMKESNKLEPCVLFKKFFAIEEIRLYEDLMVGDIFIIDTANFSLNDVNKLTVSKMATIFSVYEKVYSIPLHKIYYINCPPYMSKFMSVLKIILQPNILSRIEFHHNDQIVKDIFTKDELPKDYGGRGPSLQELDDMCETKLKEYQKRFDILDNLEINEALRPQKPENDEILGYYGNFKKFLL